jgi:hypothetical protein
VNFTLQLGEEPDSNPFLIDDNRETITHAIRDQQVGGEITLRKQQGIEEFDKQILIYDSNESLTIQPIKIQDNHISLGINGDEQGAGKTIVINIDTAIISSVETLLIEYDGEEITVADDITDVLNPNDDGLHAEYLTTIGPDGIQVLMSIPHFSEHTITITSTTIIEGISGYFAILVYGIACGIAGLVFLSRIFTHPVYVNYYRKKKNR